MVAVALLVKDSPYLTEGVVRIKLLALARSLRAVWGNPGTRLGLWSHFVSQFSVTVFSMLWGYPFLVRGQGLSSEQAGALLMAMTGWVVVSGLVLGWLVTRFPYYRSVIVVCVVAAMALLWARGPHAFDARADVAARAAGLRDGVGRAGVDGRLRPGPQLHARSR